MQPNYTNLLSISPYARVIPYTETNSQREGKQANSGFKNLITHPELIDAIPELSTDRALKSLVSSLNINNAQFFTIGCCSHGIRQELGYQYRGYIEFAWNCRIRVRDAIHYFSLFFHFDQFLHTHKLEPGIRFHWWIEETQFLDINLAGFGCAIVIRTNYCPSSEQAYQSWQASLKLLESFLGSVPVQASLAIYEPSPSKFSLSKFPAFRFD